MAPPLAPRALASAHVALAVLLASCGDTAPPTAEEIRTLASAAGVGALAEPPPADPALVAVGAALFGDLNLSGRRDIACATCHRPEFATTDLISVAIGTGGSGVGPNRVITSDRRLYPRNTPDLLNRGYAEFTELGWDGKVRPRAAGGWTEPEDWEDTILPDGLASALAAHSLVCLSDRDLMVGRNGDIDANGDPNELGGLEDEQLPLLWTRLGARAVAAGYGDALAAAAGRAVAELTAVDVANALAAYVATAFVARDAPWDAFLAGDDTALPANARGGAEIFFTSGGCADCHRGPHLTDHGYHNIAVPQVGLGQEDEEPMDYGRGRETNVPAERFAFRTPALRGVSETGPWMHDGAYTSLEAAIGHHGDCMGSLRRYDPAQLKPELQSLFRDAEIVFSRIETTLDPWCRTPRHVSASEVRLLAAFLASLAPASPPGE